LFCARSFESPNLGPYAIQAGIAATHVRGRLGGKTDWNRIVGLYDRLLSDSSSAVVKLNRAVAISMRDGPFAGLSLVDELLAGGELDGYGLAYATRADLCRRLGRLDEAGQAYARALEVTTQESERRFLEGRLHEVSPSSGHTQKR
jgi:RNA polymerase sigma-70 factor (ECF subfamily)